MRVGQSSLRKKGISWDLYNNSNSTTPENSRSYNAATHTMETASGMLSPSEQNRTSNNNGLDQSWSNTAAFKAMW
jgi:hypothetical protein